MHGKAKPQRVFLNLNLILVPQKYLMLKIWFTLAICLLFKRPSFSWKNVFALRDLFCRFLCKRNKSKASRIYVVWNIETVGYLVLVTSLFLTFSNENNYVVSLIYERENSIFESAL